MSPATLRRYRADRLLREEFQGLRERVLASVRGRLTTVGVKLDRSDLEACYAQAWQGLYAAMLSGQEVANPAGWLALTTYRRAIDEHRARARFPLAEPAKSGVEQPAEHDIAANLDDRRRLRELMEGLRTRLSEREREAAALCYLQGMTRAQAAARMGLSPKAMQKLMEGRSPDRPGVAAKVGALVTTISSGGWCEEQASLMRALAFGVLAPGGDRHRLALVHQRECPACRSYVASLRGVAVVLPPVLTPLWLGGGSMAGSAGAAGTGGAAGAGGGWLGAPIAAKLAAGCLLAVGVGAGCVALVPHAAVSGRAAPPARPRAARSIASAAPPPVPAARQTAATPTRMVAIPQPAPPPPGAQAPREFTPEQAPASEAPAAEPSRSNSGPASSPADKAAREFAPG